MPIEGGRSLIDGEQHDEPAILLVGELWLDRLDRAGARLG